MMKPTRVAVLCLAGVFVAGALFGVVAHSVYSQRATAAATNPPTPKDLRARYLNRLDSRLTLTPAQREKISPILESSGDRVRELRDRMEPEFEAIRHGQRQEIMTLLTPEQQTEYQKLIEEQRRRREEQRARNR
jgi:Spy/CpxP family protein refolding chaperone